MKRIFKTYKDLEIKRLEQEIIKYKLMYLGALIAGSITLPFLAYGLSK
jgi:hypothetical protein